ncbi:hypothetical protein HYH02_007468 [Chlamydomonas schloesseri]|uniref:Uncharacterized protein n=1 Tax=Chlamydomonas schloesseri TaxID=2026947 RepID=A0A835WHW6_9CHLO|nr:hypothetical protein HYH02_007468 [Chlamydomonas schloesseri]|eukprot:KAG2447544.1 hypothetical protein HYH02_007468 [Chlamydomonas schloesseri]
MESLDVAVAFSGVGLGPEVVEAAAAAGNLQAVRRLVSKGCECSLEAVKLAAACGHLHILQWIWSGAAPQLELRKAFGWWTPHDDVAEAACVGGQGHVLEWLAAGLPPAESEEHGVGEQQEWRGTRCMAAALGRTQAAAAAPAGSAARARRPEEAEQAPGPAAAPVAAAPSAGAYMPNDWVLRRLLTIAAGQGQPRIVKQLLQQYAEQAALTLPAWSHAGRTLGVLKFVALCEPASALATTLQRLPQPLGSLGISHVGDVLACALCSLDGSWRDKAEELTSAWAAAAGGGGGGGAGDHEQHQHQHQHQQQQQLLLWQIAHQLFLHRVAGRSDAEDVLPAGDNRRLVLLQMPDVFQRFQYAAAMCGRGGRWHVHAATVAARTGIAALLMDVLMDWAGAEEEMGTGEFRQLLNHIVLSGDLLLVRLMEARFYPAQMFTISHLQLAAEKGRVWVLDYLYRYFPVMSKAQLGGGRAAWKGLRQTWARVFKHAAQQGAPLPLLQHLHYSHGVPVDVEAVAAGGSVDSVEWAVWAQLQQELDRMHREHQRGKLRPGFCVSAAAISSIGRALSVAATWGNLATAARMLQYGTVRPAHVALLQHPADFFTRPRSLRVFGASDGRLRAMNVLRLWATLLEAPAAGSCGHGGGSGGSGSAAGGGAGSSASGGARGSSAAAGRSTRTLVPWVGKSLWSELVGLMHLWRWHGTRAPALEPHQLAWARSCAGCP